jgi:hypothetical protein
VNFSVAMIHLANLLYKSPHMKRTLILLAAFAAVLTACTNQQGNSSASIAADSLAAKLARNKAVIMASERNVESKDVALILKDCAPGFTEYGDGSGKPVTSMDSIKRSFQESLDALGMRGDKLKAIASGDTVIVTGSWSGVFKKAFMGVKPNGKSFKYEDAEIFILDKDGKILSHRGTQSSATILLQLGLLQPAKN